MKDYKNVKKNMDFSGNSRLVGFLLCFGLILIYSFANIALSAPPIIEGEWDSWEGDYLPYSGFNHRFPTAVQLQRATTFFGYSYKIGSDSMKNHDGGEKIFDSAITSHGIDFSYCYSDKIRFFTGFSTGAFNYDIESNSKMVKDFNANALDYSQRLLDRINAVGNTSYKTAFSPVYDPDRVGYERINGLSFVLLSKPLWSLGMGMQQRAHRYKRIMFYEPFIPSTSLGGILPYTMVDLVEAVDQTITHVGASRQLRKNILVNGGFKHILTYTKMDVQSAARYFDWTPYFSANMNFGDMSRISLGLDRFGYAVEIGYFQGQELELRLGLEGEDMDIRGKTQIPGYRDLRFIRKNTRQSFSLSRRF